MRVLVVGGYGLIGGHVVAELAAAGHEVIGAGRNIGSAARRFPFAQWIKADLALDIAEEWRGRLRGVQAVVNCAGALQDGPGDDLSAVHVRGLATLAQAAFDAGVGRLVHISALGVDAGDRAFGRTKREGETALKSAKIDWLVLRPGLVFGPVAFGGSALLRGLAALPGIIPVVHANAPIRVVAAQDVGLTVVAALRPGAPTRTTIDLAAPGEYRLRDIVVALRAWLGLPSAPVFPLPAWIALLTSVGADGLAWLGWRSPMRSTAVEQLSRGVRGDAAAGQAMPGLRLRTLEEMLAASPSGVQERWFAKAYFGKPLALGVLAVFWIVSGVVGSIHSETAAAVLTAAGAPHGLADTAVGLGSAADILLGCAVCIRRSAPVALRGMLVVTVAYLIGGTFWRADLWVDPLGPLVKTLPAAVLACVALALIDER